MENERLTMESNDISRLIAEREYWMNKLSGELVKSRFPYDYKVTGAYEVKPDYAEMEFSGDIGQGLVRLSNGSQARLYMILTSALVALLGKYMGSSDIIIGAPIYKQEVEGDFINKILVLRSSLNGNMSFKELLLQVRQTITEANDHQNCPIETLIPKLDIPSGEGDEFPLFDICVLLESIHNESYLDHLNINMKFIFRNMEDRVSCRVQFNSLLFNKLKALKLLKQIEMVMKQFLENVNIRIADIDVVDEAEKDFLLFDLNDTAAPFPEGKTIHRIFEEQAKKYPDRVAVQFEGESMTYQALNKRANRLARLLRKNGVKPDTLVAMVMERSIDMIVGILGILKAGGAYLPIDPDMPKNRITAILEDSDASIVLTQNSVFDKHAFTDIQCLQSAKSEAVVTAPREQITDLDSLPIPDRSLISYGKYSKYIGQAMVKNSITLQGTRGCPYKCVYCHKIWPKTHMIRTAEKIYEELKLYYDMGVRRFVLLDDIFNLNVQNSKRFYELIIENNLDIQLFIPNGMRGDILTKDYIDLMVRAGLTGLALALETGSPRLQKLIGKNLNLDKLKENIEYFCEKYPHVILELFTMHGFPTETEEEAMTTFNFVKSIKWLHFPYLYILKIFPNTDMARLAMENGVASEDINRSDDMAYHELPETLPFDKSFTYKYQNIFLNDYFLSKERLLHVLPYQMQVLTEDEIVKKYNIYLPIEIKSFSDLLKAAGISIEELSVKSCRNEKDFYVPDLDEKIKKYFPVKKPDGNAIKVLLLDLSNEFSTSGDRLGDMVEPPLGHMYLLTYLDREFGEKVNGRMFKSKVDFDSFDELKAIVREMNPDVIGIRTLNIAKNFFHNTVALIRQWGFAGAIIAGGPYATSNQRFILKDRNIDLVVIGEGEITFSEVIGKMIENNKKLPGTDVLKDIKGIAYAPFYEETQRSFARKLMIMDDMDHMLAKESDENPEPVNNPSDIAYVIYTSGSTGMPKGVMIEHRNVVRLLFNGKFQFEFSEEDVWTMFHSYAFDFSVWEMYGALLYGGKLIVVPKIVSQQPADFLEVLEKGEVTVLNQTPSAFYNLSVEALKADRTPLRLRYIVFGGEALSPRMLKDWKERYPKTKLINMYGITETTVHVTFREVIGEDIETNISNIGKPIPTLTTYIFDKNLKLVPVGVTGELCVGGDGVARGYLNRPQLTRERFVENPYKLGERIYRSGDLARVLQDGTLEYLGRIDQQVKIRGHRIELGEIESKLMECKGVKATVVTIQENENGNRFLCAYYVSAQEIPISDFKRVLSIELPSYMVPSYFIHLQNLPMTSNGKVNKKALPLPGRTRPKVKTAYAAPSTATEKILADIWAHPQILDMEKIGINDNFFELGGHSLQAAQIISRLRETFLIELSLRSLFDSPTIAGLARLIDTLNKANSMTRANASAIPLVPRDKGLPLSFAQQRLWFLDQLMPGNYAYNNPIAWRINGRLDIDALRKGLEAIVNRHEALRTTFAVVEGRPVQKIAKVQPLVMPVEDISPLPEAELEDTAQKLVVEEARGSFDLAEGPLFRGKLIKVRQEEFILVLNPHHINSDGWSWSVLFRELEILYKGILHGQTPPLPPMTVQYADFAHWQLQWLQGDVLESRVSYWKKSLENMSPLLKLPLDYPRPKVQTYEGEREYTDVSVLLTEKLKLLSKAQGVSLFMILLGLINVLFYRYTGNEDICVGTPLASRSKPEIEGLIGFFVNTLVLRTKLKGDMRFTELLHEVRDVCLEAYANQEIPFEKLVDELNVERDTSYPPLVQAVFVMQGFKESDFNLTGLTVKPYKFSRGTIRFDLEIYLWEEGDGLTGYFEYNKALFQPETIHRMIKNFHALLEAMLENPDKSVSSLVKLSEEERTQVLHHFNATERPYTREKTIHRLFTEQTARTPEHIAVSFEGRYVTYRELDEGSNRLANALRESGIGKGSLVGVVIERSVDMIISVLGILKAGGAYVPLEPYLPDARIQNVLSSLDLTCLVTDSVNIKRIVDIIEKLPQINTVISLDTATNISIPCRARLVTKEHVAKKSAQMPEDVADPGDTAYIIFTSGSTGTPKGVVVKHRPVINLIEWVNNTFHIGEEDKVLFITSLSFDLSVYDIFGILLAGGTVRLVGSEDLKEPGKLLDIIYDESITFWDSAPQALQQLVPFFGNAKDKKSMSKLRYIFLSGDWIPVPLPDALKEVFPGGRVIALGGATEATVWSNYYPVGKVEPWWSSIPYGKPIQNARYYILDKTLQPCPIGVQGDLYIGGECLASGYINDEELTASKFIDNPFIPREKIYRTGDLARWFKDGNMEFLGRADFQVKIRGYRIELGEIESTLLRQEKVKEAVVIAKKDSKGNNFLTAYYVLEKPEEDNGKALSQAELKNLLLKELPNYMIPSYFVELEKMPLTANGKLNRNALPKPEGDTPKSISQTVLPKSEIHKTIADIWKQVLHRDEVGIFDNFFDLGGNSLSIIEVNCKVNSTFRKNISVVEMFRYTTISSLAEHITGETVEKAGQTQEERLGSINKSMDIMDRKLKILRGR